MFDRIIELFHKIVKSRLIVLTILFSIMTAALLQRVFVLQIVNGEEYLNNYKLQIRKEVSTQGTRGNIYDRNGNILAKNKLSNMVTIEDDNTAEGTTKKNELLNDVIVRTIEIVESNGDSVSTDFGIELDEMGNYVFKTRESTTQRYRFLADVYGLISIDDLSDEQRIHTPEEVIEFLCVGNARTVKYQIEASDYEKDMLLKLVTIRYSMSLNLYTKYISTTIATDVNERTVAQISELSNTLPGVSIKESSLREYADSIYFSNILGYTGLISRDEFDNLDEAVQSDYRLTDMIGKAGLERTMDSILQGSRGTSTMYVDSMGNIIELLDEAAPTAGDNLYLTIDKELQIMTYKVIEAKLAGILLSKIQNVMSYNPNLENSEDNIIIPISAVYHALIDNHIIDMNHFASMDAKTSERNILSVFTSRQSQIIGEFSADAIFKYSDLSDEKKDYISYIDETVLRKDTRLLLTDAIDYNDEMYKDWNRGSLSLSEFLKYAISKNWIDTARLSSYLGTIEKYSEAEEIYNGIITFLQGYLKTDDGLSKRIYKYLIISGDVTGSELCMVLFEQGVLEDDESAYAQLSSGAGAYAFIKEKIESLEITPGQLGLEPSTASAVITDPNTGEVLACVSYPGYDNNRLTNTIDSVYYNQLMTDSAAAMYNKATQQTTAPGSTFKPLSAIAGISEGVISEGTYVFCDGEYETITPSPRCWIHPGGHSSLEVRGALQHSCNEFFYEIGYRLGTQTSSTGQTSFSNNLGLEKLAKYVEYFGMDRDTGIEIPESPSSVSTQDAVRSAIGQGSNAYTTTQLSRYAAIIANEGTVYDLTLINKITDSNGNLIKDNAPNADVHLDMISKSAWNAAKGGMEQMAAVNNTLKILSDNGLKVAGKTGTAQQSRLRANHVLFIGYAPSANPEIAISIRIANGYSSVYPTEIARDIFLYQFGLANEGDIVTNVAATVGVEVQND